MGGRSSVTLEVWRGYRGPVTRVALSTFEHERGAEMSSWPIGIGAITLFVEDLAAAKQFYLDVFELPAMFEDDNSVVFNFGNTIINLLDAKEAPSLIEPAPVASRNAGARHQFTIEVDDVDAMCAELTKRGVELLNGPMDRPWGIRTASFKDPGGHIWEIAGPLG
jgi:catechol 2,3-dioxygenase-like lactoylglutathione lyase family enzyme